MIFTSKGPEGFDPQPYVDAEYGDRLSDVIYRAPETVRFDPRPHFQPTRDPLPRRNYLYGTRHAAANDGPSMLWDPRPEFTTPSNPILVAVREYDDLDAWESAFASFDAFGGYVLWDHPKNPFRVFTVATPEQVEHARKVLTRLAVLS